MTRGAYRSRKRFVQHRMEQPAAIGGVRLVATGAIGVFHRNSAMGLDALCIADIVTGHAKARQRSGKQFRLYGLVRLVALGAHSHGRWRMDLGGRFFHHIGELRVAAKAKLRRLFL